MHGYKDVEIDFTSHARIIIAENGAGKTTILNAIYAFLKMDLYRLAKIRFDSIECEVTGITEPLHIEKAELQGFETTGSDDSEIENLCEFTSATPSVVSNAVSELDPKNMASFHRGDVLQEIFMNSPYDSVEFIAILESIKSSTPEMPKSLAVTTSKLTKIIDEYQLLYLPTYRRVELPRPKVRRRITHGRPLREPEGADGIRYGLRDVQDRLAAILANIQRYSNQQYRTISASIIDDALNGRIQDSYIDQKLPDIEALRLFFSRLESDKSSANRLDELKKLFDTGDINNSEQLILRYFLSKLVAVVDRTKQLESNVENFVKQVNSYLSLSGDEKTLNYDSNLMKVVVISVFTGEEIDLEVLSSGEKQLISLFSHLYLDPRKKIVLIDEPELSLSIAWQKNLLPDVINSPGCAQLLAITHSPFIFDNELDEHAGPMRIRKRNATNPK